MNTPSNKPGLSETEPNTEQFAGTPVRVEGQERVEIQPTEAVRQSGMKPPIGIRPTPEDLAGVPICVEGREDLRVRRVVRRHNLPSEISGALLLFSNSVTIRENPYDSSFWQFLATALIGIGLLALLFWLNRLTRWLDVCAESKPTDCIRNPGRAI
jgi:hypothetical protein